MKRSAIIFTLLLPLFFITVTAQGAADSAVVPKSVQSTFASIYPHALDIKWQRTSSFSSDNVKYIYRVRFRQDNYILSAATDSTGSHFAEFSHEAYIPEGAWRIFQAMLPYAEITDCSTENINTGKLQAPKNAFYSISFTYSSDSTNYDGCVVMDSAFNVLETWKDIAHQRLMQPICDYVRKNFANCNFSEEQGSMMMEQDGHTSYFVSVDMKDNGGSYWLFFDEKGALIKKEAHKWKTVHL